MQHLRKHTDAQLDAQRARAEQTRPAAIVDDTALDVWYQSFQRGEYSYARRQWFEVVEPATRKENR